MSLRSEAGNVNEWTRIAAQQVNPLVARFGPIARADMAGKAGQAVVINPTADGLVFAAVGGGGGVSDGDKGQIIVSGGGTVWNLDTGAAVANLGFTPYNSTNPAGYISSITSGNVTAALGYTPTSVTTLTGVQSVAAFKTGLSLVKGDVGLGSADNTADAAKNVLTATKLFTARNINGVAFDGSANITINAVDSTARLAASAVSAFGLTLIDDVDAAAARTTLGAQVAGTYASGTGSANGVNTGDQTTITGNAGSATILQTGRTISGTGDVTWTSAAFDGSANISTAATLATVNANVGTFGSATLIPVVTVNAKGLVTAISTVAASGGGGGLSIGLASALAIGMVSQ